MAHGDRKWQWATLAGTVSTAGLAALYILGVARNSLFARADAPIALQLARGSLVVHWSKSGHADQGKYSSWFGDVGPREATVWWWFKFAEILDGSGVVKKRFVRIPLWAPLVALALPTAYAWHRCRKPKTGHCPTCGYDLAGVMAGVCPECGNAIPGSQPAETVR